MINEQIEQLLGLGRPQHACPGCLDENWIGIPGPDRELTIATFCEHTGTGVARKRYANGTLGPWLTITPVDAAAFRVWLRSWTELDDQDASEIH